MAKVVVSGKSRSSIIGRLLPVVLWLLPIIALNLGFSFLARIEFYWHEKLQHETARRELEALNAGANIEYHLARHGGRFLKELEVAEQLAKSRRKEEFIRERYRQTFSATFPESLVYAFHQKDLDSNARVTFANTDKINTLRALALVFQHLVATNLNQNTPAAIARQRERLVQQFMGRSSKAEILGLSQRGKTTYIIFENRPYWLVWDFALNHDNSVYGYFIMTPSAKEADISAKLMALRECRRRGNGLGGFVPILDRQSGAVLFESLARSRLFKKWVKKALPSLTENFHFWIKNGAPEGVELGNFQLFSYLGKNQEYLSVFLIRKPLLKRLPAWLWWLNLIAFPTVLLFALRGILFDNWPILRLSARFFLLFSLAASLPLSLLGVAATGYIYQFSFSSNDEVAMNLKACLNQFDARKSQIQDAYRVAAMQAFKDEELVEIIASKGIVHKDVENRILHFFKNRPDPLPLLGFYVFDLAGKGLKYYEGTIPARLDPAVEVFKVPIIDTLRERFKKSHPDIPLPEFKTTEIQRFGSLAYESVSGNNLAKETERRRTYPISRRIGIHTATQMHDFLTINGRESAMIFIVWDDKSLDKRTLKATSDYLGLNFPTYAFVAFQNTPAGLEPIISPGRHVDSEFLKHSSKVAELAVSRGGSVSQKLGKYVFLAKPSQKYSDTIIVGGVDQYFVSIEMLKRTALLAGLLFFSFLIIGLCAWLTSIFLVRPIRELRSALNKVSQGQLDLEITSDRLDEIGSLAGNFTSMVRGMKERQQLAALLSDQAIEAISGDKLTPGKVLPARSFTGIALVCDIRNFTTLCEMKSVSEITELLDQHFAEMARIITSNGGRIYKFIGDAIEAVFQETDDDDSALRAVKSAIEMHRAMSDLNARRKEQGLFSYASGVGLAYGTFYSGQIGSEETRIDYAVIGNALARAAEMEAASKLSESFPIVVDQKIRDLLGGQFDFSLVDESISAFAIEAGSPQVKKILLDYRKQLQASDSGTVPITDNNSERIVGAGKLTSGMRWSAVLLFTLLSGLVGLGIVWGFSHRNSVEREAKIRNAQEGIFRLAEQLKSEAAPKIAFEMRMKRMIEKIEDRLAFLPTTNEKKIIEKYFADELNKLAEEGFSSSRAAAFYFKPGGKEAMELEKLLESVHIHQMDDEQACFMENLAAYKLKRFYGLERDVFSKRLSGKIEKEVGKSFSLTILSSENFGAAFSVFNNNGPEYLYWNFITLYDPSIYETRLDKNTTVLKSTDHSRFRVVGMILVAIPENSVRASPKFLVSGYDEQNFGFALIGQDNKLNSSKKFPVFSEGNKPGYETPLPVLADYSFNEQVIRLGQNTYRLLTSIRLSEESFAGQRVAWLVFATVLLSVIFFYVSIFHSTILSRSVTTQLWFSILLIAMVPVITVVFVIDLFLGEHQQAMAVQEKVELQRFIDSFEMRQFYFKPVVKNILDKWSKDKVILEALHGFDANPGNRELQSRVDNFLQQEFKTYEKPYSYGSNFTPRELFLIGRKGWSSYYSYYAGQKSSELGKVLIEIGRNMLDQLQPATASSDGSAAKAKSEMYFEAGLTTIRSSFGEDESVRLANVFNEIIDMEVVTGAAAIYVVPMPSIEQPDYLFLWIGKLSSGGYLDRIARQSLDRYAIFSIQNHAYGVLAEPDRHLGNLGLEKVGAWIAGSNLPVSEDREFGDQLLLLEGRQGIAQITNFFIAIGAKNKIISEIGYLRFMFVNLLLLSVLIIIVVAHNNAADIVAPIRHLAVGMHEIERQNFFYRIGLDRDDELGELCMAYDQLARGLAEKELMGKMLSQLAVSSVVALDSRQNSRREKYAFLFVGCPGFSDWLGSGSVSDLFADLQRQTAMVCQFIAQEGGDIDKFIGDKQLGIFMAKEPGKAVEAALKAAQKIVDAEMKGQLPFPVAIGANYGEVINGYLGVGNKRDFTVIGDAVNISARIEKEAEKLRFQRILFSEEFVALSPEKSLFRPHGEVQLKGKSLPLALYVLQ